MDSETTAGVFVLEFEQQVELRTLYRLLRKLDAGSIQFDTFPTGSGWQEAAARALVYVRTQARTGGDHPRFTHGTPSPALAQAVEKLVAARTKQAPPVEVNPQEKTGAALLYAIETQGDRVIARLDVGNEQIIGRIMAESQRAGAEYKANVAQFGEDTARGLSAVTLALQNTQAIEKAKEEAEKKAAYEEHLRKVSNGNESVKTRKLREATEQLEQLQQDNDNLSASLGAANKRIRRMQTENEMLKSSNVALIKTSQAQAATIQALAQSTAPVRAPQAHYMDDDDDA